MKKILTGFLLAILCVTVNAQNITEVWTKKFNWAPSCPTCADDPIQVVADDKGGAYFIVAAQSPSMGSRFFGYYDSIGTVSLGTTTPSNRDVEELVIDKHGALSVIDPGLNGVFATSRHRNMNQLHWSQTVGIFPSGQSYGRDLKVDDKSHIYTAGGIAGANYGTNFAVIKYDTSGNVLWQVTLTDSTVSFPDKAVAIVLDKSKNLFVTGSYYRPSSSSTDCITVKIDSNGVVQWRSFYSTGTDDEGTKIAVDENGNVFVAGTTASGVTGDMFILMYNNMGTQQWVQTLAGYAGKYDLPYDLKINSKGYAYLCATIPNGPSTCGMSLFKYDTTGTVVWDTVYHGTANRMDIPVGIHIDYNDNVFMVGSVFNTFSSSFKKDMILLAYNESGTQIWSDVKNYGLVADAWTDFATDAMGSIFVVGSSTLSSNGGTEMVITKYSVLSLSAPSTPSYFCIGAQYTISYSASGPYQPGNTFTVLLSDSNGSFANATAIGTATATTTGVVNVTIPPNTPAGSGYKLKVQGNQPVITGAESAPFSILPVYTPNVSLTVAPNDTVCAGTPITLTAVSNYTGSLQAYTWLKNGATQNETSFTYTLANPQSGDLITLYYDINEKCVTTQRDTATVTLTAYPVPAAPAITQSGSILTSTQAPAYQWYFNSTLQQSLVAQSIVAQQNGIYQVEVTDTNGCKALSAPFNVTNVSVNNMDAANARVYPNPSTGIFVFELNEPAHKIVVLNNLGEILETITPTAKQATVNLQAYVNGVYTAILYTGETTTAYSLIKQ